MVLDESGFGMKVVLDEKFWDEKRQVHPNLDETAPNRDSEGASRKETSRDDPGNSR